jgi:hypothetical protein
MPVVAPLLAILVIGSAPLLAVAQSGNQSELYKAYYLEKEAKDYAAARALYDKVASSKANSEVAASAKAGADRCRDQLAGQNFATLMPPDALAYFEISRPGQILEKLADMLGLTTKDMQQILANRPSKASSAPFHIPDQVAISPALFEVLGSFGGAGVALTNFDPNNGGPPSGVMVIHHGDATLLKGLLRDLFQFSPTAEKISDMPTFAVRRPDVGEITGVLTRSLLIVGTSRDLVEGARPGSSPRRRHSARAERPGGPQTANRRDAICLLRSCSDVEARFRPQNVRRGQARFQDCQCPRGPRPPPLGDLFDGHSRRRADVADRRPVRR